MTTPARPRTIIFNGKRYPRRWGSDDIGLTEAMDRMGAKSFSYPDGDHKHHNGPTSITLFVNDTDAPEGVECFNTYGRTYSMSYHDSVPIIYHTVEKNQIDQWLRIRKLPTCDDVETDPAKIAAQLEAKNKDDIAESLRLAADAATFAIEQSIGDDDDATRELRIHWYEQEHAYLVALNSANLARAALAALSA